MAEKTTVAWTGAASSLALTCVFQADRLAKFFGIINIPKDARDTMSALSSAPIFFSVGILLIGCACVVYLYLEHLSAIKRQFWNPKLDLLTIGLLGLVVFAGITGLGLYRQSTPAVAKQPEKDPFVKNVAGPPIEWRFDKPVTIFWYARRPGEAVRIGAIVINATNKSDFALKNVSAIITADMKTAQVFTMRVNPHGTIMEPTESAKLIPPRAKFDLTLSIGLSAEDFLNQYGTIHFDFSYEQNGSTSSFGEQFSFSYIEDQIAFIEDKTKEQRASPPAKRSELNKWPDFDKWDGRNEYRLFEVASLWEDQEPLLPLSETARRRFKTLEQAIWDKHLKIRSESVREAIVSAIAINKGRESKANPNWVIDKDALLLYAASTNEKPRFLFPEERV
jgi:uncharacterized membrane protein YidH (DUF202 family)